jgi:hypothetical protein
MVITLQSGWSEVMGILEPSRNRTDVLNRLGWSLQTDITTWKATECMVLARVFACPEDDLDYLELDDFAIIGEFKRPL